MQPRRELRKGFPVADRIRILVVDDHEIVRHGLRQALAHEADMEVVGETGTGSDAVRLAGTLAPDVVLLDVKLGDVDGPDACRRILAVRPQIAVVMLTAYLEDGIILRSLTAGAKGYLVKDVDLGEIRRTIRAVARGQSVLDPKVAARVIANATVPGGPALPRLAATLSESDLAIVRHLAKGLTNKEIGALVHLSPHTVKDRLEKIAAALEARSRTGIVAEAMRAGLI